MSPPPPYTFWNISRNSWAIDLKLSANATDAFPPYGPGTSNRARPAGSDRVLHAFVCRMISGISSSSDFRTTGQLKEYPRKQGGRRSGRNSRLVSRQVIDVRDNVRLGRYRSSLDDRRKLSSFFVPFSRRFPSILISDVLIWRTKTQQHCCSLNDDEDELHVVASLPLWLRRLNLLASRSIDQQMNTHSKETLLFLELLLALKT